MDVVGQCCNRRFFYFVAVEVGEGFGVVGDHGVKVEGLRVGEVGVGDSFGDGGPVGGEPAAKAVGVVARGEVVVACLCLERYFFLKRMYWGNSSTLYVCRGTAPIFSKLLENARTMGHSGGAAALPMTKSSQWKSRCSSAYLSATKANAVASSALIANRCNKLSMTLEDCSSVLPSRL